MQIISYLAIYFIIWWLTIFAVLPFGLRTQAEEENVVEGTVPSAPFRFRALRVFLINSLVALVIFGLWFLVTHVFGIGVDSFPRFAPKFNG